MLKDNQQYNENVKGNTAFLEELKQKLPEFVNFEISGGGYTYLRFSEI